MDKKTARENIHRLTRSLFKELYDKVQIDKQIDAFEKQGYTIQGVSYALHWWYEIEDNDPEKAYGRITIIPMIYKRAEQYYLHQKEIKHRYDDVEFFNYDDVQRRTAKVKDLPQPKYTDMFQLE